jgi:ferric enterobactin receptor
MCDLKKIIFLVFVLIGLNATSQVNTKQKNLGILIGNILSNDNGQPVSFANVKLFLSSDSTRSLKTVADKTGSFEIENIPFGIYMLQFSATGFNTLTIDSINIREERYDFNLGDLKMKTSSNDLEEVVIYAEKPLIENKDGKITYNVGESVSSNGASTAEILKNMPLVSNDPNGKILLRGKEPKILIDDKPVDLSPQQLTDLLESLPGGSIEKIELMMNPPPQYATEQGGVINIVTKKGKVGMVGKLNFSAGTRGEGNVNTNVSYRNKKFTISVNTGIAANRIPGNNYTTRQNFYKDSSNFFNTKGDYINRNVRPNFRLQTDYDFNKRNQLNFVYQGNLNYFNNNSLTTYTNINRFNDVYRLSQRTNTADGLGYSESFNLTYTHKGKNPAEVLRIITAFSHGKNGNDRDFFQQFLNNDLSATGNDSTQQQLNDDLNNSFSARVNYDKPLKLKGATISTGASFQKNNYHNILNTSFLSKQDNTWKDNAILSSDFRFHQSVSAVRFGFNYPISKTIRLSANAQAEYTQFNFEFIHGNAAAVANNYWNVLPNITLRKEFNKSLNTSLVYRASIRRPGIGELNPAINYGDPYNIRFGNPYLDASLADNYDWNITYSKGKYYINGSLGYNKVKDVFNTIRNLIDQGKTETSWQNISDRNEYESSLWGGYTFSKKFRMNASTGYSYNVYGSREKELYKYRDGGSFYTSLNYTYTASPLLNFEGNARYSSFADPQGRSKSNLSMNVGVQQKFMKKRLIASLNIIDPFRKQQLITYTYGKNFLLESGNTTQTRNVRLSISYQLNKMVQPKAVAKPSKVLNNLIQKQKQ